MSLYKQSRYHSVYHLFFQSNLNIKYSSLYENLNLNMPPEYAVNEVPPHGHRRDGWGRGGKRSIPLIWKMLDKNLGKAEFLALRGCLMIGFENLSSTFQFNSNAFPSTVDILRQLAPCSVIEHMRSWHGITNHVF